MLVFKESLPTAVLLSAVVLAPNALSPIATLFEPVVLASKEALPTAVFIAPVVFAPKAA